MAEDTKKKVLIIDDDENLVRVLADKLSLSGFEVESAGDGKEGLEKALSLKPRVILLDILMPVMDGWEVLRELRQDEWGKKAKVIMLTGVEDNESVAQAVQDGSFAYLLKTNLSMDDIADKIREMLKNA